MPEVRAFAIENALHWLRDYRFDGLRLDAVHAIVEPGEVSMLHDLSRAVGELAARPAGTFIWCWKTTTTAQACSIPSRIRRDGKYRAQWNDDYHHAWHVLLTGESHGYYGDYATVAAAGHRARARRPALPIRAKPPRIAAERRAASRAARCLPPPSSISCRTTTRSATARSATGSKASPTPQAIEAALAITLLAPMPPLLFMGEEWGSKAPFPFFCDFKGDLAEAVRKGRRKEFAEAYAKYGDEVPDPLEQIDVPIRGARLGRAQRGRRDASGWRWCATCSRSARDEIVPRLAGAAFGEAHAADNGLLTAQLAHGRWRDAAAARQPVGRRRSPSQTRTRRAP